MTTPIIIGLTGLAGAGKDSVADVLVTHAGFTKLAFADALRAEVSAAFAIGDRYGMLIDRRRKEEARICLALQHCRDMDFCSHVAALVLDTDTEYGRWRSAPRSPRQIMQWWGTEYRRAQDPQYWSTKLVLQIAELVQRGQSRFVVSDCRFANEAAALRTMGAELWRITRPGQPVVEGGHASQTDGAALDPEALLVNNGSITDLAWRTLRCLQARHGGLVLPGDLEAA